MLAVSNNTAFMSISIISLVPENVYLYNNKKDGWFSVSFVKIVAFVNVAVLLNLLWCTSLSLCMVSIPQIAGGASVEGFGTSGSVIWYFRIATWDAWEPPIRMPAGVRFAVFSLVWHTFGTECLSACINSGFLSFCLEDRQVFYSPQRMRGMLIL